MTKSYCKTARSNRLRLRKGGRFIADPLFGHSVTQSVDVEDTVTIFDSLGLLVDRAGYFSEDPLLGLFVNSNVPTLDRHVGYTVQFDIQVQEENHASGDSGDDNGDGLLDRAGFSVIAVSEDLRGLELSIWA